MTEHKTDPAAVDVSVPETKLQVAASILSTLYGAKSAGVEAGALLFVNEGPEGDKAVHIYVVGESNPATDVAHMVRNKILGARAAADDVL